MCINLQTSILAFGLGELSGLYLVTRDSIEKKLIGLFVMFYSLVQLFEAFIYNSGESANEIYSRLLLLNLGFQGIVFFLLMSQRFIINNFYLIITGIISIGILFYSLSSSFEKAKLNNGCLTWNFLDNNNISIPLYIMYAIILYWIITDKQSIYPNTDTDFIRNVGVILFVTAVLTNQIRFNCNKPGMWCLSSSISAPLFTLL